MAMQNSRPDWLQWTPEERIDHLAGQLEATFAFFRAIIGSHPDLPTLAQIYLPSIEHMDAKALASEMSEKFVDGHAYSRGRIERLLLEKREVERKRLGV